MLPHTFMHLPGIGPATERELWDSGVLTWDDFLGTSILPGRAYSQQTRLNSILAECGQRYRDVDSGYFVRTIPLRESWRMYADFRANAAFLDIETTGLSPDQSIITLVGILDSDGYHAFIHGQNLTDFREAIEKYDLIVTYNGASFDLPFIEHHFGSLFRNTPHVDLMFPLHRLGLKGGLKSIERQLGFGRPTQLSSLRGSDAVRMWRMWTLGDDGALKTLVRYNAEDVLSLPKLAEIAYNRLADGIGAPASALEQWTYPQIDLPYYPHVIRSLKMPRLRR